MQETTYTPERLKYLSLLAEQFPNAQALATEIINLGAIISLPKGTEHFMSDLHGEYESFYHILNNCSGVIREKVELWLGDDMTGREVSELCTLIYYPAEKLKLLHKKGELTPEWYTVTLTRMIHLAKMMSYKHTRENVRKALPVEYAYILDELLHAQSDEHDNQQVYHQAILATLIDIGSGDDFVIAVAALIKRLAVDHLHVVGDIFDRGPRADAIMDMLSEHHRVDVEWGNHDVLWMGAASGSLPCIAAVVRNSLSYNNTEILENGYGIPLRPLTLFVEKNYPDMDRMQAMRSAITIMMFKLEGQMVMRHPEWGMNDRLLLDKIDRENMTVEIDGKTWPILPRPIPTVDPADPYALTAEEQQVMDGFLNDFRQSTRLHKHIDFLYTHGSIYLRFNGNLLYHGCMPLDSEGHFLEKNFGGTKVSGRALMDFCERMARSAWYQHDQDALDFMWYLWCGEDSPVCGRRLTTFARWFIEDKEAWKEPQNPYYTFYDKVSTVSMIMEEFGLPPQHGRIINGHTPIKVTRGETPLKADGRLIVIDGGFCKAYQKTTGIAGYTLIGNSHGMRLKSHEPFTTLEDALEANRDIKSSSFEFTNYVHRRMVRDTDEGQRLLERIQDLKDLLAAHRAGLVRLKKFR